MKRGFTLFEILLALFVLSALVVGGIEYAQRKKDEAAAEQLGLRLYQYGIAVADYARQHPQGLHASEEYGVNWLKMTLNPESCVDPMHPTADTCKPFLGPEFNLTLPYLVIETFPGAPDPQDAQIYTRLTNPSGAKILTVELVQLGRVMRKGVDLSLASRAVNFANNFTDQYGAGRIHYTLSSLDQNGYIIGDSETPNPNVDYGYLLTSGENSMKGSIQFSSTAISKNLVGVETIEFANQRHFSGMKLQGPFKSAGTGRAGGPNPFKTTLIPSKNSVCFLTTVDIYDKTNGNDASESCSIKDLSGSWVLIAGTDHKVNNVSCEAQCLSWAL
jgi:prepilin-type N-terminal cleavage/methylation domain-containing protein